MNDPNSPPDAKRAVCIGCGITMLIKDANCCSLDCAALAMVVMINWKKTSDQLGIRSRDERSE